MRRPDLPLILIALAMGAALALFAGDEDAGPATAPFEAEAEAPDPVDDFLADFDPVFVDCFGETEEDDAEEADPGDPDAVVEQVSRRVERLRDLHFAEPVDAQFLDADELRTEVEGLVRQELRPVEVRREEEVLRELGAIPPDGDLAEITTDALGSQVVGLYDTKSKELLVQAASDPDPPGRIPAEPGSPVAGAPSEDVSGFDSEEEITLAHELEHALADQALGIFDRVGGPEAADRELAYAALVEGDATLAMELYALTYVGLEDQLALGESVPGEDEFAALPDYVQRSLLFPYLEGLRFVCHRFADGGLAAIDRAYDDPPAGTSQVIFPDRYGVIEPQPVSLPPRPGKDWERIARRELGAAELEWLFEAPGGDPEAGLPEPRELVFGWAGGEVALWGRGEERAMAISLLELPRTDSLCGAVGAWYRAGWPDSEVEAGNGAGELTFTEPGRVAVLACPGKTVQLGVAPDVGTASKLALSTIIN